MVDTIANQPKNSPSFPIITEPARHLKPEGTTGLIDLSYDPITFKQHSERQSKI